MKLEKIILLGENHYDSFRFKRYKKAINFFNPQNFTYEFPLFGADFIREFISLPEYSNDEHSFNSLCLNNNYLIKLFLLNFNNLCLNFIDVENAFEYTYNSNAYFSIDNFEDLFLNHLSIYSSILEDCNSNVDFFKNFEVIRDAKNSFSNKINGDKFNIFELYSFINNELTLLSLELFGSNFSNLFRYKFDEILYRTNLDIWCAENLLNWDFMELRDGHMINQILALEGTIIHGGGFTHFYGNYDNMYNKLSRIGRERGFTVERYLLPELDNL